MPGLIQKVDNPALPSAVKIDIVSKYMYRDVGLNLLNLQMHDSYFIYNLYRNLKPRQYTNDPVDQVISEEGSAVEECLLILDGIVEVGFSRLNCFKIGVSPYIFAYRQKGY